MKLTLLPGNFCLVMALEMESQGVFEKAGYNPLYTGIGKVNAAIAAQRAIFSGANGLINLGTAGSRKIKTHEIVHVSSFVQRDFDLTALGFERGVTPFDPFPNELQISTVSSEFIQKGRCGTGDSFEVAPTSLFCDLVDMEGYALAKACAHAKIPMFSLKYITDGADDVAHLDWKENLLRASHALLGEFEKYSHAFKV